MDDKANRVDAKGGRWKLSALDHFRKDDGHEASCEAKGLKGSSAKLDHISC